MSAAALQDPRVDWGRRIGLGFVFLWFFIGGLAHFTFTDTEMRIIPPSLPDPRLLVLVSGVFELLGAFGILIARLRSAAGWGLILLTIAVTPANAYMWLHPDLYPEVPYWALTVRMPFQVLLLLLIWWSTRPRDPA
jgi:uncharacterized membrane protein